MILSISKKSPFKESPFKENRLGMYPHPKRVLLNIELIKRGATQLELHRL